MWSTSNPPDDIYSSDQIISIEKKFDIELSEDQALEIYDMDLGEAATKIESIMQLNANKAMLLKGNCWAKTRPSVAFRKLRR